MATENSDRLNSVFVGIDVAIAKKKRLPVSVCKFIKGRLTPLPLRGEFKKPPSGRGNKSGLEPENRKQFASDVVIWMAKLCRKMSLRIKRIAIDAPSDYCNPHLERRLAEQALDKAGIRCFTTPTKEIFEKKVSEAITHFATGGKESRMPNANQVWMLVGFDLFIALRDAGYECVETYPQAIVRELHCSSRHKSTAQGLKGQIERTASVLGYSEKELESLLNGMGFGSRHDRLDALLSAWVASLPPEKTKVFGQLPNDAIVVPDMAALETAKTMQSSEKS